MVVAAGLMLCDPEVPRVPLQPPEATQLSAYVEFQLKVADWPFSMLARDIDRFTTGNGAVGASAVMLTVTLSLELPSSVLQVRV
jgi:hypothetical protein